MGMLFTDSFDVYAATADLVKKWQVVQTPWAWVSGGGRFGGGAIQAATTGGGRISPVVSIFPTNQNCLAFWLKVSGPPSAQTVLIALIDGTGANSGEYLSLNTSGTLQQNWPFGGAGLPSPAVVTDNQWHWIEWEAQGAGFRRLYIDNIIQINTSDAHATGLPLSLAFYSIAGITISVDDIMVYDNSAGKPQMADFPLSTRQITVLRPVSDGVCNFSTLSSGTTHFNLVNETNPDGDTSYCEDGTSGHQDLFNMSALGFTPANITTIMGNIYVKTGIPGSISNQIVCKSGATTTPSASAVTPNVYFTLQSSFPTDPNTGVAWTPSGLAAAQFGYKNP